MLETVVGWGAGAELVDGTGAGAELGGASVGAADERPELEGFGELDPPLGLGEVGEPGLLEDTAGWSGCALGRTPDAVRWAALWRRWLAAAVGIPAEDAGTGGCVLTAAVDWSAVWAGAVRANTVAMPTAVIALSWVARQVRRDMRRSPSERAAPGGSSARAGVGLVADGGS